MFNEYVLHLKFYTVLYVKQILTKKKKSKQVLSDNQFRLVYLIVFC